MPFLVILALLVAGFILVALLKVAFGILGLIIGNLLWIGVGAAVGYHYGKKASTP